jgi:Resolvase, N terminal domain
VPEIQRKGVPFQYTRLGAVSRAQSCDAARFISYLRVSTDKQGRSGLGLEAQREAVTRYLNGGNWTVVAEYVETESGKRSDRPNRKSMNSPGSENGSLMRLG